nr:NAD(+) synthase [Conchiformibius kuhniae]
MQTENIIRHIVGWLGDYARDARAAGFVVGISGGVDSAVVSALCARTGLTTLCLDLPIRQHPDQLARARAHIAALLRDFANVESLGVDLTASFETFERTAAYAEHPHNPLALANVRARLRMTTLYYYAQTHGLLVAGTGNKVEDFGVGFFTKYGDGGVDVSPIADLLKTQVYVLAEALGVSAEIRQAAPTDGLWDAERTDDEAQMGATYPELEWAMAQAEAGRGADAFEGRQREVMAIYLRLNRAAQHKIRPIPVCRIPPEYLGVNSR